MHGLAARILFLALLLSATARPAVAEDRGAAVCPPPAPHARHHRLPPHPGTGTGEPGPPAASTECRCCATAPVILPVPVPAPPPPEPPPPPSADAPDPAARACPRFFPPDSASGEKPHGSLTILSGTRWQPVGGEVRFVLTGMEKPPEDLVVDFAWTSNRDKDGERCRRSPRVRLLPRDSTSDDDRTFRFAALVPAFGFDHPWIEGLGHRTWTSTVPLADVYVHGTVPRDRDAPLHVILTDSVGITTAWIAFVAAGIGAVVAWSVLALCASRRAVPGGYFLGVISTPYGVASLSQFQVTIWTFVIGAGVVYVMMLTGNLIDIPATTLALLGVTGASLVGSKLEAAGAPQRMSAPGTVTNLWVEGATTSNAVVLNWWPPAATEQPFSYTIERQVGGGGPWQTIASDIGGPPYAVTGLAERTAYAFRVFAVNEAGSGPPSAPAGATTAAAAVGAAAASGPAQVTGLTATARVDGTVELGWTPLAPTPDNYTAQYRKAGTLNWCTYRSTAALPTIVSRLERDTDYEFRVFAVTGGIAGPPAVVVTKRTKARTPRWSDLVMRGDSNIEVDLARVQMLVFTTIAAVFTGITLINTGAIPDIPIGELGLIGVSNGVYIAYKVANRKD